MSYLSPVSHQPTIPAVVWALLFLLVLPFPARATHIVGGEMNYTCLGNDEYEITLTIFRDCFNGNPNAWFDDPASIGIFDEDNNLLRQVLVPLMNNDTLSPVLASECLLVPPNVCVHTTTYRAIVNLPPIPGGYQLAYQRCCRNQTIVNIIDPLDTGATYGVTISEKALEECNSNPKFKEWPPIYICVDEPIVFDQSAIDQDGDSIVYRLCTPLSGATPDIPMPQPPNNPPYEPVSWVTPPYGEDNMLNGFSGGVPLKIDPETGLLTGLPNTIGQFVVGICVEEYRNGELISTTRRDFQYNVGQCGQAAAAFTAPDIQCGSLSVVFENNSQGADDFLWQFNDPGNPGVTSTAESPVFTFSDTGTYVVLLIVEPGEVCEDTAFQQVVLQESSLAVDFDFEFLSCSDSLLIQATDLSEDSLFDIVSWEWELQPLGLTASGPNPTFALMASGEYTLSLLVSSANGCQQALRESFTASLIEEELPADTLYLCPGDSVFLNPDFNLSYTYKWAPAPGIQELNSPNPLAMPEQTITYRLVIADPESGCSEEKEITVFVSPVIDIQTPEDTVICSPQFLLWGQTNTQGNYYWAEDSGLNTIIANNDSALVEPFGAETYYFLVRDLLGCIAMDSVRVQGNGVNTALQFEPAICPGDTASVSLELLDPADTLTYYWSPEDLLLQGQGTPAARFFFSEAGVYPLAVQMENQFGCIRTDSLSITLLDTLSQLPFLDAQQCSSLRVDFSSSSINAPFYAWHFGDPANPNASASGAAVSHTYPDTGAYQVTTWLAGAPACPDTLTQIIRVEEPAIFPAFDWAISDCADSVTIQFQDRSANNQSEIIGWEWGFGQGRRAEGPNPQLTIGGSEEFTVQLAIISDDGCRDTVQQVVSVLVPEPTLPDSIQLCRGEPAFLNPGGDPAFQYSWSPAGLLSGPNTANPSVTLDTAQLFTVAITDASGQCELADTVLVQIAPSIEYKLVPDTLVCSREFLLYAESAQAVDFLWAEDIDFSGIISTEPEVLVEPPPQGTYYLQLTDAFGCRVVDSVMVTNGQIQAFLPAAAGLCRGDMLELELINLAGASLSYAWSPPEIVIAGQGTPRPLIAPDQDVELSVRLANELGCAASRTIRISVSEERPPLQATAEPDTLFGPGEVQLEATFDAGYDYLWSPGQRLSSLTVFDPLAQVDSTTEFTVRVVDESGCRNEASLTILVISDCRPPFIYVPNAFSPNGDNLNDLLRVEGGTIEELYFAVYNRWGEKVFETYEQQAGWDGTYKGERLAPDVFGYYLEVGCYNGEQYFEKGNVTIIR